MQFRELDEDELRKIKVKKKRTGEIADVSDALADGEEAETEEEFELTLPEEEYEATVPNFFDDLKEREKAGLAAEQENGERAAAFEEEGDAHLRAGEFEKAETAFEGALLYEEKAETRKKLWIARTKDFTETDLFLDEDVAWEVKKSDEEVKAFIRERAGEKLKAQRAKLQEELEPLKGTVLKKQEERRPIFESNLKRCRVRCLPAFGVSAAFFVGAAISLRFLFSVRDSMAPAILAAIFGGVALCTLFAGLGFLRKWIVARRLYRENEDLTTTEEGIRCREILYLLERLDEVLEG